MPLSKLDFKAGVDKERPSYASEGGWYETDKVRFRKGLPEKIGGWERISANTFLGVCRSLHTFADLNGVKHTGVGTHLKFYVEKGGIYYDVTPLRKATANLISNPFITDNTSASTHFIVRVMDTAGGYTDGDFVTIAAAGATNGIAAAVLNKEYQISHDTSVQATADVHGTTSSSNEIDINGQVGTIAIGMTVTGNNVGSGVFVTAVSGGSFSQDKIQISATKSLTNDDKLTFTFEDSYTIDTTADNDPATSSGFGGGTTPPTATYQINTGVSIPTAFSGWGAGFWGESTWGVGGTSTRKLRLWSQGNFGEDLVFGPRGGELFFWDSSAATGTRGVKVTSLGGASQVPTQQNLILVSDISRFVICFGTNDVYTTTVDPMLVRWSDQESVVEWAPSAVNQAGSLRLSRGSEIIAAVQSRQEVLVWTDAALYNMQYVGAPDVWTAQLVGENISIASQNAVSYANGMAFWMGKDKFYVYDGNTKPLPCSLHRFVFGNFSTDQYRQVLSGSNEEFHEIWWFYCSAGSSTNDTYVIYNYLENIWYHGTMARTAWVDSGIQEVPVAATYTNNLVRHETGVNDNETGTVVAITATITSAQFDLDDGHQFSFVWRVLPDLTFEGSVSSTPSVTMSLFPLKNSGSDYNSPLSEGGTNIGTVTRASTFTVEAFTQQINTRVRGRQMAFKVESTDLDVQWQLGYPRIDMRPDGRR
tara:strand:+ start:1650 stop:3761 length:2112 start_codon:yes stop_codon:yes gene_type:complete